MIGLPIQIDWTVHCNIVQQQFYSLSSHNIVTILSQMIVNRLRQQIKKNAFHAIESKADNKEFNLLSVHSFIKDVYDIGAWLTVIPFC